MRKQWCVDQNHTSSPTPDEAGADPTRHRSATSALHKMTGTLEFAAYRSGVFYLDTALVTFPEAFRALLRDSVATPPA